MTYQISDGEGGFATGHLVVDVTPDDVNPNVSLQPENQIYRAPIQKISSESDYGQTWEISGAVLSAAGGHRSLDAVARAMTARQYILNAVNGIADGNGQATQGEADITSEHAEKISYSQSALSQGRLTSDPLKGFALRTVYGSGGKELIVETLLGRDNLYLNFSGIDRSASNAVADWTVELADGRPLPDWIKRDSARSLISEVPSGVELLNLKISATFFDGSTVERYIAINLRTGEIIPIKPPRDGRFAPPVFGDMFDRHAALRRREQRWLGALISENS